MNRPAYALPYKDPASACAPAATGLDCLHCGIRHLSICAALAPEESQALEAVTVSLPLAEGTVLARTGDTRRHVYTLTGGALRLVRTLADGRRQVAGFVLPGDYVGLTEATRFRYDVEAITDSRVCRVQIADMQKLRSEFPHLERKLLQRACLELDAAQDAALALARMQPIEKLADFLLTLASRLGREQGGHMLVDLPMGRADIADHLGLTMETVSRTFTKLRTLGLIALPHQHVVEITDSAGLHRLAANDAV